MVKKIFILAIFVSTFVFAFAQKGFVNPAARYAQILGYDYKTVTVKGSGEVGMVTLPDGSSVNAWDFYRGNVGQQYSYPAKLGYTIQTERQQINGYTVETPICIRTVKGKVERLPLDQLLIQNGIDFYTEDSNLEEFFDNAQVDPNFKVAKTLPTAFDWRNYNGHAYIGAVKDQGSCGDCYAFGATACAEGVYNFATGSYDGSCSDFSESYISFCLGSMSAYSNHFSGCNGADYDYQELQALCDIGTIPESYFPYSDATNQSCPSAATNAPKTKFTGWYRVACSDENAIKTAIMTYGVVDAAVYVSTNFQNYTGGIYSDSYTSCDGNPCSYTTTNHAISLVGWGTDATYGDYWILRNSWGSSWGESGYMRLKVTAARISCSVAYLTYSSSVTPTAPTATTVAASSITTSGATLNGTVNNNNAASTTVTFEYGTTTSYGSTKTATPSSVTGSSSSSVSASLTGLAANTTYHFRVKAVNSVGTTYGSDKTFTTSANPTAVALPLTQNFAASTMPTGWTTSNTGTGITERWSVSNTANAGGSAYEMKCSYQQVSPGTTMLITPALNTSGLSTIILNAKYMLDDYGAGATIKVQVSANKTTWTDVSGWSLTTASNTNRTGSITNLSIPVSGTVNYVAFVVTGNLYQIDYFYLDNVSITSSGTVTPTAPTATTVAATSITTSGATINGTVNNKNAASTTVTFEYGTTTSYGSTKTATPSSVTGSSNTSVSASLTGLAANTTYHFRVKAVNSVGTTYGSDMTFTTGSTTVTYCTSKGNSVVYEWIDYFKLGTLTNTTSKNGGYGNFTSMTAPSIARGSSQTVYFSAGFKSTKYTEYYKVYIDYNHNGVFTDAGELVVSGSSSASTTLSSTFTVSTSSLIGTTRLRIVMSDNSATTSCGSYSYGETEDYTVNITGTASPRTDELSTGQSVELQDNSIEYVSLYPVPAKEFVTVKVQSSEVKANVSILNIKGQIVKTQQINSNLQNVDINDLPSGTYNLIYNDGAKQYMKIFVKE